MNFIKTKQFRTVLRFFTLVVVITNATLAYFNVLAVKEAVLITIGLEFLIGLIFVFLVTQGVKSFREAREQGASFPESLALFAAEVVPSPVMKIAKHELDMWKLASFLVRRKINAPTHADTFQYGSEQRAIYVALIIVSIVEIIVIELIVPWKTVRLTIIVLSIYGAIWLFLFYKSYRINPHYLDDNTLVLRVGLLFKLTINRTNIKSVRMARRTWGNKFLSVSNQAAIIKHGSDTNVEVLLNKPTPNLVSGNSELVDRIYFAVDNPQEFVQACEKSTKEL